jgi:hypothetical protein
MNNPKAESTDNRKIGPDKWLSGHAPPRRKPDAIVPVKIRRNQFVADFDCPGRVDV